MRVADDHGPDANAVLPRLLQPLSEATLDAALPAVAVAIVLGDVNIHAVQERARARSQVAVEARIVRLSEENTVT